MVLVYSLLGALLLAGCSTPDVDVSVTFDPLVRFPEEATYRWDRERISVPHGPRVEPLEFGAILEETVEEAFRKRGYRPTEGSADYALTYTISLQEIIEANASHSIGAFWLDLSEAEGGRRIWTGYGRAQVHVGLSREERKARIRKSLERLLTDFPPSQRPK